MVGLTSRLGSTFNVGGMGTYRISQLADRVGVPASTLRFYDRAGLVPADRSGSGYRLYGDQAIDRVRFIQAGKQLGLGLEEIAEVLTVWQNGACREVKAALRPRLAARIDRAETRRSDLAEFVTALKAAVDHLDTLPDRSGPCDPDCDVLHPGHDRNDQLRRDQPGGDHRTADTQPATSERWREAPVACSLDAEALTNRTTAWRQLVEQTVEHRPVPDGIRLALPSEHAPRAVELAIAEQACCPFFDFHLHLDGDYAYLTVRAPEHGQQMITDLLGTP